MQIGLDIGSTTIKLAVLDDAGTLLFSKYQRHYSQIAARILELHKELMTKFPTLRTARLAISGSAGIGIAESCGIQFVQEVFAEKICTEKLHPGTDAVIELGGEDAKILFLGRHFDARMNDSCAGGTGAFIDQMAALLHVETAQMNFSPNERARAAGHHQLHYRQPLWCFCQKRYPAPFKSGCGQS